jgi:hypothetical protein
MVKDIILSAGKKITRVELEKQGWVLLMHLPNDNEVFCRYDIKIMWDPQKEEVIHLFTTKDIHR